MNIRKILQSGNVVRFHNSIGMDKQKNSDHQWEVALIIQHIYPECSKEVLLAALTHDAAEYITGDIPFPAKQGSAELKEVLDRLERQWEQENGVHFNLHPEELFFLKLADTFSGMWYCILQVREGKINAKRPFRKWRQFATDYLYQHGSKHDARSAEMFLNNLVQEMEEL